jgi:hypothetical protein
MNLLNDSRKKHMLPFLQVVKHYQMNEEDKWSNHPFKLTHFSTSALTWNVSILGGPGWISAIPAHFKQNYSDLCLTSKIIWHQTGEMIK